MLLFKPEHVQPIITGRKTQTRRDWKRRRAVPGAIHWAQTGYGKVDTRFARLEILRVWQEPLVEIGLHDALAEGYDSVAEYLNAFLRINRITEVDYLNDWWTNRRQVWCVEFKAYKIEEKVVARSLRQVVADGFDGPEHLVFVQSVLKRLAAADDHYSTIVEATDAWIQELCDTVYSEGEYPFGLKSANE